MGFKKYLQDRLGFIMIYYLNTLIAVTIMFLSIAGAGIENQPENIIYTIILATFGLLIYLGINYNRQKPYLKTLGNIFSAENVDDLFQLQNPVTQEQHLFQNILAKSYDLFQKQIVDYEGRQRQHLHFINQWVHQMKTPVSVINFVIQDLLELEIEHPQFSRAIHSIEEESEKLAHGLEMILYTARISQFELDFKVQQVELISLIRSVVNQHKKSCIRYRIFPKIEAERPEIYVETDLKWMGFVFNQLITNAIKYSREPQDQAKNLFIRFKRFLDGWYISIIDQGVGIPPQDISRVFDPFFTGENGRRFSESTGMGLYLAKEICNKLNHELCIKSTVGVSTEVILFFPDNNTLYQGLRDESYTGE